MFPLQYIYNSNQIVSLQLHHSLDDINVVTTKSHQVKALLLAYYTDGK